MTNIEQLVVKAIQAAGAFRRNEEAAATQLDAKARLVRAIAAAAAPAMGAIGSRVIVKRICSNDGMTTEPAPWRGLYVEPSPGPRIAPRPDRPGRNGTFVGQDLLLTDDPDRPWALLTYSGQWEMFEDIRPGIAGGAIEISDLTAETTWVTDVEVARGYDPQEIVRAINRALDAQAQGNRERRTGEYLARAEYFNALAAFMEDAP